jgi:tRNA nucleotidyltransferase (CCA-adding enzyme)
MEIFEVGGAVRDALLQRPVTERDWVVVGGTAEELERLGYRRVGKDFPVFLHPRTGEEYALARTETKIAPGYYGFEVAASPSVTLEADLGRRDLTINAMARASTGEIIDPYGGQRDLAAKVLRHVSAAFTEDPLRVLRVARFAARFAALGFTIAAETRELMREITASGEIDALRPERIWQETDKALAEPAPQRYFEVLRDCGALAVVFPEIDALFGVPQPPRWHPEIDTGVHTLMALRISAELSAEPGVRFAVLTHDLGKAETPAELLPRHRGHEERSVAIIARLCARLPVPRRYRELAQAVARYHGIVHRAHELKPSTLYELIEATDALRRPARLEDLLLACEADARGRSGLEAEPYPQRRRVLAAREAAAATTLQGLEEEFEGAALGAALRERRIAAIHALLGGGSAATAAGSN